MSARTTTENLAFSASHAVHGLTGLFLRFEDWLEERASARTLYRMDDQALSDIAMSRSDVERVNETARKGFWRH